MATGIAVLNFRNPCKPSRFSTPGTAAGVIGDPLSGAAAQTVVLVADSTAGRQRQDFLRQRQEDRNLQKDQCHKLNRNQRYFQKG
ncbi:hypothetical protein FDZ73_04695 [bacterium]|nr:MAG: hypothetical protein FDZ73_04695 [bacterium]